MVATAAKVLLGPALAPALAAVLWHCFNFVHFTFSQAPKLFHQGRRKCGTYFLSSSLGTAVSLGREAKNRSSYGEGMSHSS